MNRRAGSKAKKPQQRIERVAGYACLFRQSLLPILVYQPPPCHFFARGFDTIAVTDPILVRHCLPQWNALLGKRGVRCKLLIQLIESVLNSLQVAAVRAVWIHCAESEAFDANADVLAYQPLAW